MSLFFPSFSFPILHGPPYAHSHSFYPTMSHSDHSTPKLTILDDSNDAHRQVYEGENKHESHLSHEVLAGAASFAGMKAFEDHQRKEGRLPDD